VRFDKVTSYRQEFGGPVFWNTV